MKNEIERLKKEQEIANITLEKSNKKIQKKIIDFTFI